MNKIFIAAIIILAIAGFFLFDLDGGGKEISASKPQFKTVQVQQGDFKVIISATGVVEPDSQVEVKSKASGEILQFSFEEGDFIKKNTLLLKLDKSDEKRNLTKAKADLRSAIASFKNAETNLLLQETRYETNLRSTKSAVEAAQANLREAKDKLLRQKDLFIKKVASQEALDSAVTTHKVKQENLVQAEAELIAAQDAKYDIALRENDIELARADIMRAQIAVDEAVERLEETEIYSPIEGILIKKNVEKGQIISSGISNIDGGTTLGMIADMSRLFITADVDETDIGVIRIDQPVVITTDAFPVKTFQGVVKRIAPKGEENNKITIFKVKIEIKGNDESMLRPQMTANVDIITHYLKNILFVPRETINKDNDRIFAVVLDEDIPQEVPVTTGIKNTLHIEIKSGVSKGMNLIAGNWKKIKAEQEKKKDKGSTLRKMLWLLRSK